MTHVVITGGTRGIGYGMPEEFLKRGCKVVISGRTQESVQKALHTLRPAHGTEKVFGFPCEVSDYAECQKLWEHSISSLGTVAIWINNAGIDIENKKYWELPFSEVQRIVDTNLMGVMNTSHVVLQGMVKQGGGTLYNMEGFGSNGMKRLGMTSYGTTKYALRYFTQSLQVEAKELPLTIGTLSPGIVVTNLLTGNYEGRPQEWERAKRIFNILADKVETVTPYLVEKVLANKSKTPAIAWLTTPKIAMRFMSSPFVKRKVIE
jgi:short-subunit dehydrogenase